MYAQLKKNNVIRPGMTLLEMVFVILIMIVLLTAGIISGGHILKEGNARTEIMGIQEIMSAARLLKTQTGYPANNQMGPELHNLGLIPESHSHSNGANIKNSFGGAVNFRRLGGGGVLGIEYTNIPQAECRIIAHQVGSSYINAVGDSASSLKAISQIAPDDIAKFCKDPINTLVFATEVP